MTTGRATYTKAPDTCEWRLWQGLGLPASTWSRAAIAATLFTEHLLGARHRAVGSTSRLIGPVSTSEGAYYSLPLTDKETEAPTSKENCPRAHTSQSLCP